jgi:hypothetical protein
MQRTHMQGELGKEDNNFNNLLRKHIATIKTIKKYLCCLDYYPCSE